MQRGASGPKGGSTDQRAKNKVNSNAGRADLPVGLARNPARGIDSLVNSALGKVPAPPAAVMTTGTRLPQPHVPHTFSGSRVASRLIGGHKAALSRPSARDLDCDPAVVLLSLFKHADAW